MVNQFGFDFRTRFWVNQEAYGELHWNLTPTRQFFLMSCLTCAGLYFDFGRYTLYLIGDFVLSLRLFLFSLIGIFITRGLSGSLRRGGTLISDGRFEGSA